ncbi:MAG: hypothetical protein O3C62_02770 [Actinomycetota bacterium]|nr:hypothetical protein [Actinomycetota bacterium]MDA3000589.1 hypothetical protein [Actinomycetota bacterium]
MDLTRLSDIAGQQHGVITRSQFLECRGSPSGWSRMNGSGRLRPIHPGVSSLFGYASTRLQEICAATLSVGDRGIASHVTAAELWNAWTPLEDQSIHVIVERSSGGRVHRNVKHHRPRDLADLAPIRIDGIRVTSAPRTLLDVAAVAPHALSSVVERMLLAGHITRHRLKAAVALHSKQGRTGIIAMRELLMTWPYSDRPADSVLELRMDKVLGNSGLPPHQTQIEEGPFRIDFGWSHWKVAGELDGWGKYDMLEQFERLTERDRYLQLRGWIVLHFTWRDVQHRPKYVIRELRRALNSRGWR